MVAVVGCSVCLGKGSRLQRRWYCRSDVGGSVAIVVVGDYVWGMQLRTGRSLELKKAFQVTRPVAFWWALVWEMTMTVNNLPTTVGFAGWDWFAVSGGTENTTGDFDGWLKL